MRTTTWMVVMLAALFQGGCMLMHVFDEDSSMPMMDMPMMDMPMMGMRHDGGDDEESSDKNMDKTKATKEKTHE